MSLLIKALSFTRFLTLRRQLREMRKLVEGLSPSARSAVATLTMGEIQNAARAPVPHLYGSSEVHRYQPWGDAGGQAFQRARSSVAQLKLRGIALWLAVVYHETRDIPHEGLAGIHREVLGLLGLLKGTYANPGRVSERTA
ncbi:MAG: hypothetical protein MEQ07_04910 [Aquimonas sp.]|nr:hypothetical protein [Aquimonas sp.]